MREHICHSALIWQNATSELEEQEFWSRFSVARIVTEAVLLDVRNHILNANEHQAELADARVKPHFADRENDFSEPVDKNAPLEVSSTKPSMPLQEMIHTSFTLKSNINFEKSTPHRPQSVFTPSSMSPSRSSIRSPSPFELKDQNVPSYVLQAAASLQREALLLRNELNFEIWLSRENIKHIGRLYQDRSLVKSAEAERQGLVSLCACMQDILSPLFLLSIINFASIADKSCGWKASSTNTKFKHLPPRTSMPTGTVNSRKNSKSCVKKKNPG